MKQNISSSLLVAPLVTEARLTIAHVEISAAFRIPDFQIIGLPGKEISEARERIRSAIDASGFRFPRQRVVVNLTPAGTPKSGTGFDLPVALSVLRQSRSSDTSASDQPNVAAWGELGLGGEVKGVGRMTRALVASWNARVDCLLISLEDWAAAQEALSLIHASHLFSSPAPKIIGVNTLTEAWETLNGIVRHPAEANDLRSKTRPIAQSKPVSALYPGPVLDRWSRIAAAGRHHLLLLGPQGTGKSCTVEWLSHLLPDPSPRETLERVLLQELLEGAASTRICRPPVRRITPQHRPTSLLYRFRGRRLIPGELPLAHGGLVIADEFPEWHRDTREALREPLDRRTISLPSTSADPSAAWQADFLFAATGNLCPCGRATGMATVTRCHCSSSQRLKYFRRLSGPILDRIDIVLLWVQPPSITPFTREPNVVDEARTQVEELREALKKKWGTLPGLIPGDELEYIYRDVPDSRYLPQLGGEAGSLRGRHKVMRVALTLAAAESQPLPTMSHLVEASLCRPRFDPADTGSP